jgi:hypothetical protein
MTGQATPCIASIKIGGNAMYLLLYIFGSLNPDFFIT